MSETGTGGAPAGWYEDGVNAGQERYWDGTQWTDQFRPLTPVAPPAPPAPEPVAGPTTAAPATQVYPPYQPATAGPRAPGTGLSKGAIIGIVAGGAAVVVAIILILGFTVWGWAGGAGGPASNAQQQQFLDNVKRSSSVTASDAALVEAGNALCDAGRTIIDGDYLGGMTKYLDLFNSQLDLVTLGSVALYAMQDLCPDVQAQLDQLGESFTF